jgi:hypothetical protein
MNRTGEYILAEDKRLSLTTVGTHRRGQGVVVWCLSLNDVASVPELILRSGRGSLILASKSNHRREAWKGIEEVT